MGKTGVQLLREFFSPPPVSMDELKALTAADRAELVEAIATQQGLKKHSEPNARGRPTITYS